MRAAILGLAGVLVAGNAFAADYLRGSTYEPVLEPVGYRWAGWYVGGQAGWSNANFDFSGATQGMLGNLLRSTLLEQEANISGLPNLPNRDRRAASYGAFGGYNAQWGDVVLGVEVNYSHTSMKAGSTDSIARSFVTSNQFNNDVFITSSASATLTDFASLRLRAGYAMGSVMPYAHVGLAIGQVNLARSVSVRIIETDVSPTALDPNDGIPPRPGADFTLTDTGQRNNAITYGFAVGGGVDVGLSQNFFLRAEYEFMQFAKVGGVGININTLRGGVGVKF